jgi:hypothetical protein
MLPENAVTTGTIGPAVTPHREVPMVRQERWVRVSVEGERLDRSNVNAWIGAR